MLVMRSAEVLLARMMAPPDGDFWLLQKILPNCFGEFKLHTTTVQPLMCMPIRVTPIQKIPVPVVKVGHFSF